MPVNVLGPWGLTKGRKEGGRQAGLVGSAWRKLVTGKVG